MSYCFRLKITGNSMKELHTPLKGNFAFGTGLARDTISASRFTIYGNVYAEIVSITKMLTHGGRSCNLNSMKNENSQNDFNKVMEFIVVIDGLKSVFRQTKIIGGARFENDAEHSWHICVMACLLRGFFQCGEDVINTAKAVKMLLLHDMVELYAGDTYCYNSAAAADKLERETKAARKLFGTLPKELGDEFMALWLEFDAEETPDAVFASIMDKIQPFILNYNNNGESWLENGITKTQVVSRMSIALDKGPEPLREYVNDIINKSVQKGYLKDM